MDINGNHEFLSPDGKYGLRLFDYLQETPPQSLSLGLSFRFEIVRAESKGESGIRFEQGSLHLFNPLFEKTIKGSLSDYRAYVLLRPEDRENPRRMAEAFSRLWMWTDDSAYLIMVLVSRIFGKPNKVVVFDLAKGILRTEDVRGLPKGLELRQIGERLINDLKSGITESDVTVPHSSAPETSVAPPKQIHTSESAKTTVDPTDVVPPKDNKEIPRVFDRRLFKKARFKYIRLGVIVAFICGSLSMVIAMKSAKIGSGWILWGVSAGFGVAIATVVAIKVWRGQRNIPQRLKSYLSIGNIVGKPCSEFCDILGEPNNTIDARMSDTGKLVHVNIWHGCSYFISICFDEENKAVCINSEQLPASPAPS